MIEFELDPDPGGTQVPEEDVDLFDWAVDLVRQLAGPDADGDVVLATAEDVVRHARLAHQDLVELAYVFLPDPLGSVLAACHIELVFGTPGDLPSAAEIAGSLARRLPAHLQDPDVDQMGSPPDRRSGSTSCGRRTTARSSNRFIHVVEVAGLDAALLRITTSWRALALGEVLVEQGDRMAAGLVVRMS